MSEASKMLLGAVSATQRVTRAAMELAAEIPLEPGLDEEEETAEEEEPLTEGEEASRPAAEGERVSPNPEHLVNLNKSDDATVSQPSE